MTEPKFEIISYRFLCGFNTADSLDTIKYRLRRPSTFPPACQRQMSSQVKLDHFTSRLVYLGWLGPPLGSTGRPLVLLVFLGYTKALTKNSPQSCHLPLCHKSLCFKGFFELATTSKDVFKVEGLLFFTLARRPLLHENKGLCTFLPKTLLREGVLFTI